MAGAVTLPENPVIEVKGMINRHRVLCSVA